ncbi:MAG: hypothetical protein EP216_03440 [Epsilonproteobacteria bacterium]|nr:MAG: hypothetical protein EP216_03440 [Campylobacterota bacterium]
MINKSSTFISGVLAFGIYFTVIGIVVFYFGTREQKKPVHFVKKNEDRIRVTMSSTKPAPKKEVKKQPKKVVKPKPKPKPKKTVKKKEVKKKVIKEKVVKKAKVVKKKKDVNTTKPKKVNKPKDLFANVTSKKKIEKPKPKVEKKPVEPKKSKSIKVAEKVSATELVSNTLKNQKKSDSGIENAYLAMIEEKLKGWPAQSDYAGEKARVSIRVEESGAFRFKVVSASGNDAFNAGLIAYLKQLQKIGFGPHKGNRPYELDVEFIAKE